MPYVNKLVLGLIPAFWHITNAKLFIYKKERSNNVDVVY